MLRESIAGSEYTPWIRERFNAIAINTRGDREVVFDESTTVTEKKLAEVLRVNQTPAIIFLDARNEAVLRSDGYRTKKDFKRILDFVDSKSYLKTDLSGFIASRAGAPDYRLRPHPGFSEATDLGAGTRPVMVIFEDRYCTACDLMHDTLLKDDTVNALMARLTVVRLDAESDEPIVTPAGARTTPREWAASLGILARPAIVMMDGPRELVRIAGVLRRFHFQTALRYVAEGGYHVFPSLREYSRAWQAKLLSEGKVIDVGVQ